MENFNDIIKQKAENFEVPFNEAHWAEMDAKLNKIQSKKKKTILFGSAATIITLAISTLLIFSSKNTTNLNSDNTNITESKKTKPSFDQPTETKNTETKKEILENPVIVKEVIASKPSKTIVSVKKPIKKIEKSITKKAEIKKPVLVAEKNEPSSVNIATKKRVAKNTNKPEAKSIKQAPALKAQPENKSKQLLSKPIPPKVDNTVKAKTIRHKTYEDENVSKKNIRRRRRGILSFLSFKKKRYKVPLARRKSSRRKK